MWPPLMRIVQINLHHSKLASANLVLLLVEEDIDVALVQEPWVYKDAIMGLRHTSYNLFYKRSAGKPRTCILAKKCLNIMLMSNYSSGDLTAAVWEREGGAATILASSYMAHDDCTPPPPLEVRAVVDLADKKGRNLLLGCDANAHHTIWGSSDTNERGESLFSYLVNSNLSICNRGNKPTFVTANREEVLDITLANEGNGFRVENWRVSDKNSFSDHCWILFELNLSSCSRVCFRNPKKTNWIKYDRIVRNRLKNPPVRFCLISGRSII